MNTEIAKDRLAKIDAITLSFGNHKNIDDGACVMELVAYLANEPWSDHPECACPAITAFAIKLNDGGPQWVRDELKSRVVKMIGTRGSVELQKARVRIFVDFAIGEAERVLPIFENARPGDDRPRKAIEAARTANSAYASSAAAYAYAAAYADADAAAAADAAAYADAAASDADAAAAAYAYAAAAYADAAASDADAAAAAYAAAAYADAAASDAAYAAAAYAAADASDAAAGRWRRQLAALDAAIELKDTR